MPPACSSCGLDAPDSLVCPDTLQKPRFAEGGSDPWGSGHCSFRTQTDNLQSKEWFCPSSRAPLPSTHLPLLPAAFHWPGWSHGPLALSGRTVPDSAVSDRDELGASGLAGPPGDPDKGSQVVTEGNPLGLLRSMVEVCPYIWET